VPRGPGSWWPRKRYSEIVVALVGVLENVVVGDPRDPATEVGPLVSSRQRERVEGYIAAGLTEGARIAYGGGRPEGFAKGWSVEPTLFVDASNDMRIAREEISGPDRIVIPYDDVADAVRIANDSSYRLAGAVFTEDPDRGIALVNQVRAGLVAVNSLGMAPQFPFGGYKTPGSGGRTARKGWRSTSSQDHRPAAGSPRLTARDLRIRLPCTLTGRGSRLGWDELNARSVRRNRMDVAGSWSAACGRGAGRRRQMEWERVYSTILVEDADQIGVVTLNRPHRMNAWTPLMGVELRDALIALDARNDIRAVVVTGAGRGFCAGADLSPDAQAESGHSDDRRDEFPYWEMNTPIIAAMNGPAVGVGMTMPLQWDLRIVAEDAKYGFVFGRRGLVPELGSTWLLPRLVGLGTALDLLLTGRIFTGREAAELGIANEAVPAGEVLSRALEIARDIAANVAPVAAALTKRLVHRFLTEPDRAAAELVERRLAAWTAEQTDLKEGAAAFFEKRPPRWRLAKNDDFPEDLFHA
jgi:Enoyl-CoA hydratase/carnithine racemase